MKKNYALSRSKARKYRRMVYNAVMGLPLIKKIRSRPVKLSGLSGAIRTIGQQPFFV